MNSLSYFLSFSDANVRNVVIGSVLLTACAAMVGCFTFLRKRALVGDAVAHSVLPGVCVAFLLTGSKNPFYILIGAFATGLLSIYTMDFISKHSKIKADTALALVLSLFFGVGILLLTIIQHSGNASQTGLDSFLFGKAASLMEEDLWVFGGTGVFIIMLTLFFFKEFKIIAFDIQFAQTIGLPVKFLEFLLTTITVISVVIGIQAVGVILMAAMLITPAAAARFWTDNLSKMILIAMAMAILSGIAGAYISFLVPFMPTGPWMVMFVTTTAMISFMFAPRKGILAKWFKQRNNRLKILEENILKAFYQLGERKSNFTNWLSGEEITQKRAIRPAELTLGLSRLLKHGYIEKKDNLYKLTTQGKNQGERVTRLHRLWEMYLTRYLQLAPDHVHDDAETIEHIITPELEKKLEELLGYPAVDPHQMEIPYRNE